MATKIEWVKNIDGTAGKTWNPVTGCTKVSEGCRNCYAESIANRFWKDKLFIENRPSGVQINRSRKFTDVQCHLERLEQPLHWRKPSMVFVNSMSDLFHKDVPFEFIDKVFAYMITSCQHTFQILTKRPERMLEYFEYWFKRESKICSYINENFGGVVALAVAEAMKNRIENVWLGVSVENQKAADERIPHLLQTPASVRFLSVEPYLEPINILRMPIFKQTMKPLINWIIVGCESGNKRRPCSIEMIEDMASQCSLARIPLFIKQMVINGKVIKDIEQFPEHLRIREYPQHKF